MNNSPLIKPHNSLPPDPSAPILAGVAPLITRLTDFTVHAFLAQSQPSGALCGAPALLLVGKAGAGKTAIVQAVSRALKFSPRAFACKFSLSFHSYFFINAGA